MVTTGRVASSTDDASAESGLPAAYEEWRSSRLGQITDALEESLLLDLLGPLRGLSVLDVGCGDGALASALARRGGQVTGLDMDPQMLAAAERRTRSQSLALHLVEGRMEALPFPSETFDRVVAVAVLCFVGNTDQAMSEIARVLKPGGQVVIGELGRWNAWAALRRVKGWFGAATWTAARFRSARELRSLVEACGLDVTKIIGAIYYPHIGIAALLLAPFDRWCGRRTTVGAAFIAVLASKHQTGANAPDKQRLP